MKTKISNQECTSPAIRSLGSLFNLTNVFLRDEGSNNIRKRSSLPKHIIFKYDDDDEEEVIEDDSSSSRINMKADRESRVDGDGCDVSIENTDILGQEKKNGATKGKRKRMGGKTSFNLEAVQDGVLQSDKLSEKEYTFDEGCAKAKTNIVLEEHKCDESPADVPSSDGNALGNYNEDDTCHCTGSFGKWRAIWDSYYMRNYFCNVETHESTWYPPPGLEHLALNNISNEPNDDMVIGDPDPDHAISSNGSDVTCKSSKGECGTAVKSLDQPEHTAERLSCGVRESAACNCVVNGNESEELVRDCFDPSQQCSYIPNQSNTVACDELFISPLDEEGMETIIAGEIENDAMSASTKRKKKARKSRSRKKTLDNCQEQLFQCTVDAYYSGIGKYWCQRYLLFSKFDQGIKMDEEGWFSVTPECIARHQASRCGSGVIIDCFAGAGGNAIQFAKMGRRVIAIDIDPKKIEYAKHNATIYGVEGQIDCVIADSISLASKLKGDTVFLSPPWGGPGYSKLQTYDMSMLKPRNGQFLFDTFKEAASMIVMFLPRNVNINQLAELCLSAYPQWSVDVEKNFLNGKFKAVTAYFSRVSLCNA